MCYICVVFYRADYIDRKRCYCMQNAYNLPLMILSDNSACGTPNCTISNLTSFCQAPNVLSGGPEYGCMNTDGRRFHPTSGTRNSKMHARIPIPTPWMTEQLQAAVHPAPITKSCFAQLRIKLTVLIRTGLPLSLYLIGLYLIVHLRLVVAELLRLDGTWILASDSSGVVLLLMSFLACV